MGPAVSRDGIDDQDALLAREAEGWRAGQTELQWSEVGSHMDYEVNFP